MNAGPGVFSVKRGLSPFSLRLQKLIFFEFYCIVLCEVDINENFDSYRSI